MNKGVLFLLPFFAAVACSPSSESTSEQPNKLSSAGQSGSAGQSPGSGGSAGQTATTAQCEPGATLGRACTSSEECSTNPAIMQCIQGVCAAVPHTGECYDDSLCAGAKCEGAQFPCKVGVCSGGGVPWATCQSAGDCVLEHPVWPPTGQCGEAEAVNAAQVTTYCTTEHYTSNCSCKELPPPDLLPSCQANACVKIKVSESSLSACTEDSDCVLQGADCCTDCTTPPERLVAIRADSVDAFRSDACQPEELQACAKCPAEFPLLKAVCNQEKGHCAVISAQ